MTETSPQASVAPPIIPIEVLWEPSAWLPPERGGELPTELRRYGERLAIPLRDGRPTIIANVASSVDGVLAMEGAGKAGQVAAFFEPDRFIMGLLRSLSDAVIIGAGSMRAAPSHEWTPRRVNRHLADHYASWRKSLGLGAQPATVIVTARGNVDPNHPALNVDGASAVVLTTDLGATVAGGHRFADNVRVVSLGSGNVVTANAIVGWLHSEGMRVALCEGGPSLLGTLLAGNVVDELFLTVAPRVIGLRGDLRTATLADVIPPGYRGHRTELRSVRRAGDYLFLRHRLYLGD